MDFKRLGYFVQVAELGSVSRTAERLRISQPSLSRQIRLLEEELGVTLFARGRRGMELTDRGEELRDRLSGPLRQIGHVLNELRAQPDETTGTVVFGLTPTTVSLLADPLARAVAAAAPRISLRIVEGYSGHLHDWLQRGELDGAILYGPSTPPGLNATKLLEDELVLVGPAHAALRSDHPVEFSALADLPLILPSHSHGLRMSLEAAAARARCKLKVKAQADSYQLLKELVESGQGYTALPPSGVSREAADGRLTYAPIVNPKATRVLFLAMQPGSQSLRAVLQVEKLVRQQVAVMAADGRWQVSRLFDLGDS